MSHHGHTLKLKISACLKLSHWNLKRRPPTAEWPTHRRTTLTKYILSFFEPPGNVLISTNIRASSVRSIVRSAFILQPSYSEFPNITSFCLLPVAEPLFCFNSTILCSALPPFCSLVLQDAACIPSSVYTIGFAPSCAGASSIYSIGVASQMIDCFVACLFSAPRGLRLEA